MELLVHYLRKHDDALAAVLRAQLAPGIILTIGEDLPTPADFHILIAGKPREEHLQAGSRLQTLIIPWAGVPQKTRALMLRFPGIAVHNTHHNAAPAAEMAVTLMLAAAKELLVLDRSLRRHDWRPRYAPQTSVLLEKKTAVILGYGAIGRRIGRACFSLGMDVIGVRRAEDARRDGLVKVRHISDLGRLLPRANVLFIALPLTSETSGMLGDHELGLLPRDAVIVNIARGDIINEQALYRALTERRVRAGLDVWYNYPQEKNQRENTPPSTFPFHELDNVVMTPHVAGDSAETESLCARDLAELLNYAAAEKPLPNKVDLHRGY